MKLEPVKFLLVDDTPENLVALDALLRRDGLELLKANSGAEALELLLLHDVALALLDVQMPNMDGFELAELMRGTERTRHVPIIFVTAGARDARRTFKGYETGAVDFLYKPIDQHILSSKADVFFELYLKRRELSQSLSLNEMFMGILGHDLRNPLSAMMTGAKILQDRCRDEEDRRVLARMASAGQRMTGMIEQLLDLTRARLGGGMTTGTLDRLDVAELVRCTVDELRGAFPDQRVSLGALGDCRTVGDADQLLQVFSNLIANALHHGDPLGEVTVEARGEDAEIAVRVHNRGVIPSDILPSIFEPFRSRQRHDSKSRGLGLGLFISQQIVAAHGGTIQVASEPGTGTQFVVRLPRRTATS